MGQPQAGYGTPGSNAPGAGPLYSGSTADSTVKRALYGLTAVYRVVHPGLVSNLRQRGSTEDDRSARRSQRFTTGANLHGYELGGVQVQYVFSTRRNDHFSISVHAVDTNGHPGTKVADLTYPDGDNDRELTFGAPAGVTLQPGTTYAVVVTPVISGTDIKLRATTSDGQDTEAASGWSVEDAFDYESGGSWVADTDSKALRIRVRGTPKTGPPGKPTGLGATAMGRYRIDLSWTAPAMDGGSTITGYRIESSSDAGANWTDLVADTGTTATAYSHTLLPSGSTRHYRVSAINAEGTGPASDTASATTAANIAPAFSDPAATVNVNENTPAGQNIAGAGLRATDANGDTLTYSFLTTGGTDYQHFAIDSASGQVKTHGALDHEARNSYSVTVRATDLEGAAGAIAYTIEVTDQDEPPSAPGAPAVAARPGTDDRLDVSWNAPANAGKPAITSYDLHYRPGMSGNWIDGPQNVVVTSAVIPDLSPSTSYQVEVLATNADGDSDWSDHGTGSTGAAEPPAAPTGLRTTPSNGRVTLSWTAPSSTGGAAITRYEYELDQSGTWTTTGGTATSYTVGNLNNEQSYTFRVRAVNSAGESAPSAPRSATPTGLGKIVIGFRGVSVPEGVVGQLSFPEDVGTAVLTAYLDRSPETALSVPWFTTDDTAVSPDDYTGGPGTLTFAPGETEQTISIPIVDDAIREDPDPVFGEDESFLVALEFGDDYRLKNSGLVMVLILDNDGDRPVTPDPPGVTVSPSALTVAEGTTVTYTVRLDSEPTGNVTLTPSSDNPDVTFSPATLTFTKTSWATAQTVTVTAAQDSDTAEDQATISHAVAGEDYGSVPAASVSVTVTDTDTDDDTDGGGGGESTSPPVTEDRIYYLPHLAVGEGWQTSITYINYSSHEVNCQTNFLSDQGTPLRVSFAELGTVAGRTDIVPPGGSVHQESNLELSAPLARGWARVTCSGPVKASLLYRRRNREGMPTAEAGVNATTVPATRFVTFAEQGEGRLGTGVAYANPSATAALVTFTARDADGEVLASDDLMLSPNGHGAQNMAPLFGLSSFTGSLEVTSTAPIVSLSLNFEADPVFSSLPPGELDAAAQ